MRGGENFLARAAGTKSFFEDKGAAGRFRGMAAGPGGRGAVGLCGRPGSQLVARTVVIAAWSLSRRSRGAWS